jgi:hypothetical protein
MSRDGVGDRLGDLFRVAHLGHMRGGFPSGRTNAVGHALSLCEV